MFGFITRYFERKNQRHWQEWQSVVEKHRSRPDLRLATVESIRQNARTGTKAVVQWWGNPDSRTAIWLPGKSIGTGDHVLGPGGYGHGEHHNEPVFFFKHSAVVIPRKVHAGYVKHERSIRR